jgi:hypothetical protein
MSDAFVQVIIYPRGGILMFNRGAELERSGRRARRRGEDHSSHQGAKSLRDLKSPYLPQVHKSRTEARKDSRKGNARSLSGLQNKPPLDHRNDARKNKPARRRLVSFKRTGRVVNYYHQAAAGFIFSAGGRSPPRLTSFGYQVEVHSLSQRFSLSFISHSAGTAQLSKRWRQITVLTPIHPSQLNLENSGPIGYRMLWSSFLQLLIPGFLYSICGNTYASPPGVPVTLKNRVDRILLLSIGR